MMLSEESSYSSSSAFMIGSASNPSLTYSEAFSSLSMTLMAAHLLSSGLRSDLIPSSALAMAPSTDGSNLWGIGSTLEAVASAFLTSSIPVPLEAVVSTTVHPSILPRLAALTEIPLAAARSIMFRIITTGVPISRSCTVRYRFLSRLEASTTLRIRSGFSFTM